MSDVVTRQIARELQLAAPGDVEALSAWLMSALRSGAASIPMSGQRAAFAIRIRKAADRIRRRETKQRKRRDQCGLGPGKPEFDESTVIKETVVRSLLCHPWPTSIRQTSQATSPHWAVSIGGPPSPTASGWFGMPGELYLSPVLERGVYRFVVWYRENHSIHFRDPEELFAYLGPQERRGWSGQPRLLDWAFYTNPGGTLPCP